MSGPPCPPRSGTDGALVATGEEAGPAQQWRQGAKHGSFPNLLAAPGSSADRAQRQKGNNQHGVFPSAARGLVLAHLVRPMTLWPHVLSLSPGDLMHVGGGALGPKNEWVVETGFKPSSLVFNR